MREMADLAYDMLMDQMQRASRAAGEAGKMQEAGWKEKQTQKKVLLKPQILLRGSEKMKTKERMYSYE